MRFRFWWVLGSVLGACLSSMPAAHAIVYTVGTGGACQYADIGSAAAAADAHPGPDEIHVAGVSMAPDYTQQAISISVSSGDQLDIIGGFSDCLQAASTGTHTIIDGAGGATDPVMRITVAGTAWVRLSYLTLQHGDEDGSGKGGGIYFDGNGVLELQHCSVIQNTAGYGGGIYMQGTGTYAQLVIGESVAITANTARFDGGGVVADGAQLTMTAPDSYLAFNHAPNGYGGGLLVKSGGDRDTKAYLGSASAGGTGPVYANDAKRGGGVALLGDNHDALLYLFTADPAQPMRIRGNTATAEGGGIWLRTSVDSVVGLQAWYAWIEDNIAPHGAAMFVGGGEVVFNEPGYRPSGSTDCPTGAPCGGIVGNAATDDASQPVGGVVEGAPHALFLKRMTLENNTGKFLLDLDQAVVQAHEVLIDGNSSSDSLILLEGADMIMHFVSTTIAGNSVGGATVFDLACRSTYPCQMWGSIVWQPGKPFYSGQWMDSDSSFVDVNPRFVDPEHGDYSLRAGSTAIDWTLVPDADTTDLFGNPREVDLPIVVNYSKRDLGAIERQTLQPLVLNSDFDADLRLWNLTGAGVTTRDTTQNKTGAQGSGSAHVSAPSATTGTTIGGLVQCVHLPGPGIYTLNGWGHGTGTAVTPGDIAELYWEFRRSGGENCSGGAPDVTGWKVLSTGNSWSRPATPAYIQVTPQDWTSTSSIAVTLVAQENGVPGAPTNAWFDGITLGVDGDDAIFANGFEVP